MPISVNFVQSLKSLIFIAIFIGLSGCSSCRNNAPHQYEKEASQAVANLRYLAQKECWGDVYDMLSARTQDEYGKISFRLGAPGAKLPQSDVVVTDLFSKTNPQSDAFLEIDDEGRECFWYLQDETEPEADRCHFFQILMLRELIETDDGKQELWRFALQDQVDRKLPFCGE